MADEERIIMMRLVGDASNLLDVTRTARENIESVKLELIGMQAASRETMAVIRQSFETLRIDPLRNEIAKLKAELKELGDFSFIELKGGLGSTEQLDKENIMAILGEDPGYAKYVSLSDQLATKQAELAALTKATASAMSELGGNARKVGDALIENTTRQQSFTANVELAKREMQSLVDQGSSLQSATQAMREEGIFKPGEIAQAKTELAEAAREMEKLAKESLITKQPFVDNATQAKSMSANIELATQELFKMVQGGESLDVAFATLSKQKIFDSKDLGLARQHLQEMFTGLEHLASTPVKQTAMEKFIGDPANFDKTVNIFEKDLKRLTSTGMTLDQAYVQLKSDTDGLSGAQAPLSAAMRNVKSGMKDVGDETTKTS